MVALVGVKPHLAMAERAQRFAVRAHVVGDEHHLVPLRPVPLDRRRGRLYPLGNGAEIGSNPALIALGQILVAEQQHGVLVPSVLDLANRFVVERVPEVDAANFRPNDWMQLGDRNCADLFRRACHLSFSSHNMHDRYLGGSTEHSLLRSADYGASQPRVTPRSLLEVARW